MDPAPPTPTPTPTTAAPDPEAKLRAEYSNQLTYLLLHLDSVLAAADKHDIDTGGAGAGVKCFRYINSKNMTTELMDGMRDFTIAHYDTLADKASHDDWLSQEEVSITALLKSKTNQDTTTTISIRFSILTEIIQELNEEAVLLGGLERQRIKRMFPKMMAYILRMAIIVTEPGERKPLFTVLRQYEKEAEMDNYSESRLDNGSSGDTLEQFLGSARQLASTYFPALKPQLDNMDNSVAHDLRDQVTKLSQESGINMDQTMSAIASGDVNTMVGAFQDAFRNFDSSAVNRFLQANGLSDGFNLSALTGAAQAAKPKEESKEEPEVYEF